MHVGHIQMHTFYARAVILPRDAMQVRPMPSCGVRLSVRPSITFVDFVETNKDIFKFFHRLVATPF